MNNEHNINTAYSLYMPQIRQEITELYDLVSRHFDGRDTTQPYNILEIGTKYGGTFYLWNSINWDGLNISIDVSDGGIHGGISEKEMDDRDEWFKTKFKNCKFIRGNSHSTATQAELLSLSGSKTTKPFIDFLFIDGDHSYNGVKLDWIDYSPFVRKGGIVAFHDIQISKRHHDRNVYVGEFWQELKASGKYKTSEIVYPDTNDLDQMWGGIGVIHL
jgi:predicted O-methyltransferase YrrM